MVCSRGIPLPSRYVNLKTESSCREKRVRRKAKGGVATLADSRG